jgi:hypothetical protein
VQLRDKWIGLRRHGGRRRRVRRRIRRETSLVERLIFVNLAVMVLSIGFIYSNLLGQDPREFIPYLTIGIICGAT